MFDDLFKRLQPSPDESAKATGEFARILAFFLRPKVFTVCFVVVLVIGIGQNVQDLILLFMGLALILLGLVARERGW